MVVNLAAAVIFLYYTTWVIVLVSLGPVQWTVGEDWVCLVVGSSECLVVSPSPDKMMIVGGYAGVSPLNIVEECVV